ncbi:MAG: hypothetical protein HND56_07985 [Pseudomonadota bacterium]|nr:hypothetical protein [Pseudomonadota bacterium]QKK05629.1 MAG: hypothetical protein HND56_07985 [Pseudomonadota bacterium]
MRKLLLLSAILLPVFATAPAAAEEPPLPFGLGGGTTSSEPALPAGLGGSDEPSLPMGLESTEPALPSGIDMMETDFADSPTAEEKQGFDLPFHLTGFIETRAGIRLPGQNFEKDASIGETRLQLQAEKFWDKISTRITADFIADPVADRWAIDLDNGDGWIDLREAFVSWRATDFMDVKAGRQILTWGTGDLIFLNDLFPKDFDSFFIGRDEEYLKAPSDALKTSFFSDIANLDVVYTPNFDSDRFADGARISTFNPFTGGQTSRGTVLMTDPRGKYFTEDEWAMRLYRNFGAYETALYGYDGYWKNPQGLDVPNTRATFPRLSVYGASIRGPVYHGIGNMEVAYYDSKDDRSGRNAVLPNSQFRVLMGYEQEIATELTGGFQYNLEHTTDYDRLIAAAAPGSPVPDENRHVFTLRLTKFLMNQNVKLSLFNFLAPGDSDGYTRGNINWKLTDQWTAEAGGNLFYGESRNTFFGQLEDNSNLYVSLRYSF